MRPTLRSLFIALALAACASAPAFAQAGGDAGAPAPTDETAAAHPILIHLAGGGRIEVDEANETADGVWYRRGNVTTLLDRARVVRVQREPDPVPAAAARADRGEGSWNTSADLPRVEGFFRSAFKRPLPVSALGQSSVHDGWGYDHRHAVDIGLHPDGPEGRALVQFLRGANIPFRTFRAAVPGVATGPHIHIGRPSRKFR